MWSYMAISVASAPAGGAIRRSPYSMQAEAFLENLSLASRSLAEAQRRDAGGTMEGAHEVGEVADPHVVSDGGHRALVVGQKPRRMAQSRAHQILVRADAEHAGKQPQEVERAEARFGRGVFQVDRA